MQLSITHETRYRYTPAVEQAEHLVHLCPRETPTQQRLSHVLELEPSGTPLREQLDVFGNIRHFFSLRVPHDTLKVRAHSVVDTRALPTPVTEQPSPPWTEVRDHFRYKAGVPYDVAAEFVFPSPLTPRHEDFATYARPSFDGPRPLLEAAWELMERIHTDFTYESFSTQVNTPAHEALLQRKGVCQDFAHIMVTCLRMLGLPARYVSGYLLTQPPPGQPRLVGSDASHAWVSVYVPGPGGQPGQWHDLDPTNRRAPGEDYVTVAWGRDYADVSPLRGVIHGGASHTLEVAVTVMPLSEDTAA